MLETFDNLTLISLDETGHQRTCNYWYLVQHQTRAHTAFETAAGLYRWMDERGLTLAGELPAHGIFGVLKINGSYRQESHLHDADVFPTLETVCESKTMSNGDYVVAKITRDANGVRCVHTLNPNVKDRQVFDYWTAAKEMR